MRGFDLEQLRTFATVVEVGSLSAAAPGLHLSQSSVSEQVRKLEERAGVSLLVRSKRGVQPTSAGLRLLEHARRIVALNEAAFEEVRGQAIEGELRVAITDYFRTHEIAGMLVRLRECYPRLRLHVSTMRSQDVTQAHARGEIDLGVVMSLAPTDKAQYPAGMLRRENLSWVASPALAARLPEPLPLVLLAGRCLLYDVALRTLEQHRVPYQLAHSAAGAGGLLSMLQAGLGVGCLCASAIGEGLVRLGARNGLPGLPQAMFSLLPPRGDETEQVLRAGELLRRELLV